MDLHQNDRAPREGEADAELHAITGFVVLIVVIMAALLAVYCMIWDAVSSDVIKAIAPTAAEVTAPEFNLERKLAEVAP